MTKKLTQLPEALTIERDAPLLATTTADGLSKKVIKASLGILTNTKVKVANHSALFGELVLYDPSGGTFQIDAPGNPIEGQRWALKNVTTSVTAITIDGSGNNMEDPNISALSNNFMIGAAFVSLEYIYTGLIWVLI